ncbi:MAG: NTP transferase domain-containing protein [Algicola sp.]|nr:NTP transferase domain-containing protein [Algicola sp.]
MGDDKSLLKYHKIPQREYMYHLLEEICHTVYLSVNPAQHSNTHKRLKVIVDQDQHNGPFNGIISAYNTHKNVAWLVLACDLPLMDSGALKYLIRERNPDKMATAFVNPETGHPEPLACIWEPKGLENAIQFLRKAEHPSPKKFLMDSDIALVHPTNSSILFNANTNLDYTLAIKRLSK